MLLIALTLLGRVATAQFAEEKNIIIITLDGFRWQEVFNGAAPSILFDPRCITDSTLAKTFWDDDPIARRKKLMPFLWSVVETNGQLYGNRKYGNKVNCANPYRSSFPGYSEMLTGKSDLRICRKMKKENRNVNVLEAIQTASGFDGDVAVFSTWKAFPNILAKSRSSLTFDGAYVNPPGDGANDSATCAKAFAYLKEKKPSVLFISLDGTDAHGHGGRYDLYLKSAFAADRYIAALWSWIQSTEEYKDKTSLIITTDHGRGSSRRNGWKHHGLFTLRSGETWIAVMGPAIAAEGEVRIKKKHYQKQIAATIGTLMGVPFGDGSLVNVSDQQAAAISTR
jgi:hypothetical protein